MTVALALATAAPSAWADPVRPPGPGAAQAQVFLTTPDRTRELAAAGSVPMAPGPAAAPTITVDPSREFQQMIGFGASLTESSAVLLSRMSAPARDTLMRTLFDTRTGNGLNVLRQPVGGSDFVATKAYTFNDIPPGETDFEQRRFSIEPDTATIIPMLRQALQINPRITVIATPWSPPAWMKTSGSLIGGQLKDDPRIYQAYARYLVKFLTAYRDHGIGVDYLTVQNEPQLRTPDGYPGTDMPSVQQVQVIQELGPMIAAARLQTKILAYDHNWATHPNDIANTPPDQQRDINRYPQNVLSSDAARYVAGTAFHCYYGGPDAMTALHRQFPTKDVFFTECSGSQSGDRSKTFSDTLRWHSRNLGLGSPRNWARTVVNWNLALDPDGGPHVGGCGTCTGVVTIAPDGSTTTNAEFYVLGHLSRFVRPGAVRIASTSFGTPGWNGEIQDVAFRNPDGSRVLVVHNQNDAPRPFSVRENGVGFDYTLPGGSLATFVWPGSPGRAPQALDPAGWTATAEPAGPTDPCCTGDVAARAVDDDATTRWTTGRPQTAGQYLQIDFGRPGRIDQIVLDTGRAVGDFPRSYTVETSIDGRSWADAGTGTGTGQLTTIDLQSGRPGFGGLRFVRVTLGADAPGWWSVADVRAYRR